MNRVKKKVLKKVLNIQVMSRLYKFPNVKLPSFYIATDTEKLTWCHFSKQRIH